MGYLIASWTEYVEIGRDNKWKSPPDKQESWIRRVLISLKADNKLDNTRSVPASLNVGTLWELFGNQNAPGVSPRAFFEVPSGIEPLYLVLQTSA